MKPSSSRPFALPVNLWSLRWEAAHNWLALGLLLAAWNSAEDAGNERRPASLRGYSYVSVRAATRAAGIEARPAAGID